MNRSHTSFFNLFRRSKDRDYNLAALERERQSNELIERLNKSRERFHATLRQIDEMRAWSDDCGLIMKLARDLKWEIDWAEEREYWLSETPCLPISLGKYLKK